MNIFYLIVLTSVGQQKSIPAAPGILFYDRDFLREPLDTFINVGGNFKTYNKSDMTKMLLPIAILICIIACTSTKQTMDSWIGKTKRDLIMQLGPPSRTTDDGSSGEILVYAKQVYIAPMHLSGISTPGADGGVYTSQGTQTPSSNYWQYKMYFINTDGKVYHWLIQKQQVPPQQIDLNIYRQN